MVRRREQNQLTGVEALREINKRLGGLFNRVRASVDEAEAAAGDLRDGVEETISFVDERTGVSGVAGFRMRVGDLDRDGDADRRGRASKPGAKPAARAEAEAKTGPELDVEVHDDGEAILAVARLDGDGEAKASVRVAPTRLSILLDDGRAAEVDLSAAVRTEGYAVAVRNGILEVRLEKDAPDAEAAHG
ncbi:MAG: hypothetical protein ACFB00_08730 [Parvularculaceae bacterium]